MRGIYTALITPFDSHNEIDFPSLERVLRQQIGAGIRGFVVAGTTGESSTLSIEEKEKLFRFVWEFARGKSLELVAGTGSNDTRETIALTKLAQEIGYRKFLIVVPYYNKPSQAGLLAHFRAVADSVSEGEVVLYNVPGRTGISLEVGTIVELARHPRVRALKEASGDLRFLASLRRELSSAKLELSLLSGDDVTYSGFVSGGGHGVISVSSHVCPRAMLEIESAVARQEPSTVERLQAEYLPIFQALFVESNPGPLKWMLSKLGLCENRFRLPLVPVGPESERKLAEVVGHYRIEAGEYRR
jgi:4-hydroxy-tetrahydrodipicolinate synthase